MKDKPRSKFADLVAGLKDSLSKKQDELDAAGIERKAMEISPGTVDGLRAGLTEKFPDDEQSVEDVLQLIVDVLAAEQPASDMAEEVAALGDVPVEEDEEDTQVASLTEQIVQMGKDYNSLVADVSEVVQLTHKAFERISADTKSFNGLNERLVEVEKSIGQKPRRASQSPETQVDPESAIAKSMQQRTYEPPAAFADMFTSKEGGA